MGRGGYLDQHLVAEVNCQRWSVEHHVLHGPAEHRHHWPQGCYVAWLNVVPPAIVGPISKGGLDNKLCVDPFISVRPIYEQKPDLTVKAHLANFAADEGTEVSIRHPSILARLGNVATGLVSDPVLWVTLFIARP
jgi:hypothetical protein